MKAKFRVGDRVRCVDADCSYVLLDSHPRGINQLEYGKEYTVSKPFLYGDGAYKYDRVELVGTTSQPGLGWNTCRFELVESASSYIICDDTLFGLGVRAERTVRSATDWIEANGTANHIYIIYERVARRKFEVVDKVQRELKAL